MSQKVYISLKESEDLIFDKSLTVPKNRLDIQRAQDLLSVNIVVDPGDLLEESNQYLILFSAIKIFDIPEDEINLFVNHYRVPTGLINTIGRKVRDHSKRKNTLPFVENEDSRQINNYLRLRNAMAGMLHYNYEMYAANHEEYDVHSVLNAFTELSEIKKLLLLRLFEEERIPIFKVNVDKFVTEHYYRIVWWGKFISDNYLKKLNVKNEEDLKNPRLWLKGFLEFENIDRLNKQLIQVPDELKEEINFLLGYYFAAIKFESFHLENNYFMELYEEITYEHKNELFYWISFFTSFFNPGISQIYFIDSLRQEVLGLEKLAYELTQNELQLGTSEKTNFGFKEIERSTLIAEFDQLKNGRNKKPPQLIKASDAKIVFQNELFIDNLQNIGFEINSQLDAGRLLNYCWTSKNSFGLHLNATTKISDIIFYVNSESKAQPRLQDLRLKTKRIERLLNKKKVLVAFMEQNEIPKLIQPYSSLLRQEIEEKFDKIVIVLLVDLNVEDLQSIDFDKILKSQEMEYQRFFNIDVELMVKNIQTKNDIEIKRTLKNSLEKYRINQIEVVDEKFDNEKAIWLIDSGTEYYIDGENTNFYSYLNLG